MSIPNGLTCDQAWASIKQLAKTVRSTALAEQAQIQTPTTAAGYVRQCQDLYVSAAAQFTTLGSTPGLTAYARSVTGNGSYDLAGALTTLVAALNAVTAATQSAWPADGQSRAAQFTFGVDGSTSDINFTAGNLSGLVALLQAVINALT